MTVFSVCYHIFILLALFKVLLPILRRGHAQMRLDKLPEERQVGEVEFGAYLLDGLVAVAKLLTDGVDGGFVDVVKG
jgi:hypothetical protein